MTEQDTIEIMAVLEAHVPLQFDKISPRVKDKMLKMWTKAFSGDSVKVVGEAVWNYIQNDLYGSLPTIGKIKEEVRKIIYPNEPTEQEAVNMIMGKLSWPSAKEAFESLPPALQKVVGSHRQLATWGYMDTDTVQSVVSSNIQRSLKPILEQERAKQRMGKGESTRAVTEKVQKRLPKPDTKGLEKEQQLKFIEMAKEAIKQGGSNE